MLQDQSRIAPSNDSMRSVGELPTRGPSSISSVGPQAPPGVQQVSRWKLTRPYFERFLIAIGVLLFSRLVHYSTWATYLFIALFFLAQFVSEVYMQSKFGFFPWNMFCILLAADAVYELNKNQCVLPTVSPTSLPTTVSPSAAQNGTL